MSAGSVGDAPGRSRLLPQRVARLRAAVISASIGAGHDGAARTLAEDLRAAGFVVDRFDFLRLLPGRLGDLLTGAYAAQLRVAPGTWGWLLGTAEHGRLQAASATLPGLLASRGVRGVLDPSTSLVVSTYPLASQALGALRRTGRLDVPVATFLTDMSVHPLWIARGVDMHLALHAVPAAEAASRAAARVEVCRPAVAPVFKRVVSPTRRRQLRQAFNLPDQRPIALVTAGSWGVGEVSAAACDIAGSGVAVPVVACGHNDALRQRVIRAGGIALGWVDDMASLLGAVDVVVQNAGGLTSLEALTAGLPVASFRCLPGHGTRNAAALHAAGLAPWIRRPAELATTLSYLLHDSVRPHAAAAALAAAPRAVDVLIDFLAARAVPPMTSAQVEVPA